MVWDDTVAPETAIDIEATHVTDHQMLYSMGIVAIAFSALIGAIALYDPAKKNPVVARKHVVPYDGMQKEIGLLVDEEE